MGFLDIFKKSERDRAKEELVETPWHVLSSMKQLDDITAESKDKPVAIFKHSTRCGISRMVLKQFEKSYDLQDDQLTLYFLDLLENRDVSNEIAARFKVHHESPQMIVLKDGEVIHHDSHQGINAEHLKRFV
ncbi:bacillithiol system redox-active protein YtxJ [Marixanthomonas sp. SCSIO 43207]|uniref:bacillithiol system redox-active protein YtxJ n=1 Tax=Marixanthomonas sp. SCSIO 43207 TaxID=2779360 RepID=UPI001CA9BBFB|nr:bacillithiol system redox-active protein YtxJ [Marixanthomonas sp. SCSIO 43207]UAB81139.1 bacillithiol system redox-active protein YtxJ [Marixanthomonas sp. SCSIO 43207]